MSGDALELAWNKYRNLHPWAHTQTDRLLFGAGWQAAMKATYSPARVIPSRTGDPGTSHAAAKAITVKAGTQRAHLLRVFAEVSQYTDKGLTDEEAATIAAHVSMSSEYSKRCSELREAGYIEPTGDTRSNGSSGLQRIVSRVTDKGREAVKGL